MNISSYFIRNLKIKVYDFVNVLHIDNKLQKETEKMEDKIEALKSFSVSRCKKRNEDIDAIKKIEYMENDYRYEIEKEKNDLFYKFLLSQEESFRNVIKRNEKCKRKCIKISQKEEKQRQVLPNFDILLDIKTEKLMELQNTIDLILEMRDELICPICMDNKAC